MSKTVERHLLQKFQSDDRNQEMKNINAINRSFPYYYYSKKNC